jgi:hypothetical protein
MCSRLESSIEESVFTVRRKLADGSVQYLEKINESELPLIGDIVKEGFTITMYLRDGAGGAYISLEESGDRIGVYASASDGDRVDRIREAIDSDFRLVECESPLASLWARIEESSEHIDKLNKETKDLLPSPDLADDLKSIPARFEALERAIAELREEFARRAPRLQCFLSYRFTPQAEPYAAKLQQFLSLLGVDVLTGAAYEPRGISAKVRSRLSAKHDLIVLLVATDGETMWTRDEIAFASGRGIPVIPLVEQGADFAPGLFGDLEYVTFASGHVGDAFIRLLEGVNYIKAEIQATQ